MTSLLDQLLSPLSAGEFFGKYWGRTWLHRKVPGGAPGQPLIPVSAFDRLLQSGALPAGFVGVVNRGVAVGADKWSAVRTVTTGEASVAIPERLLELFHEGATLILNRVDYSVAEVGDLCHRLAREFQAPVRANAYLTPPGAQGFARHRDGHEVMALQIFGRKTWTVYPAPGESVEIQTEAGDVLYIPNGLEHEAQTSQDASVHLTLGIHPVYGYQLIEELARVASSQPGFRRPIPAHRESAELTGFIRGLEELLRSTGTDALMDKLWQGFVDNQPAGWNGRLANMLQVHQVGIDTRVRRRREIVVKRHDTSSTILVEFCGRRTSIPRFLGPALDRILEGESFVAGELPGLMTDEQKVELVRSFVISGLLAIVQP